MELNVQRRCTNRPCQGGQGRDKEMSPTTKTYYKCGICNSYPASICVGCLAQILRKQHIQEKQVQWIMKNVIEMKGGRK